MIQTMKTPCRCGVTYGNENSGSAATPGTLSSNEPENIEFRTTTLLLTAAQVVTGSAYLRGRPREGVVVKPAAQRGLEDGDRR